jgi:hypothetical protein
MLLMVMVMTLAGRQLALPVGHPEVEVLTAQRLWMMERLLKQEKWPPVMTRQWQKEQRCQVMMMVRQVVWRR